MNRINYLFWQPGSNRSSFHHHFVIILLMISFIANNCRNTSTNAEKQTFVTEKQAFLTYTDGYGFTFDLPEVCEVFSMEDLEAMKKINPTITFIGVARLPFGNTTISVSAYDLHIETPIDSAFYNTVKHVPVYPDEVNNNNYRLLDHGIQRIEDKTLRYKISESISYNGKIYSLMYYFMKNDHSDILYEIKSICPSEDEIETTREFLEMIALTAGFVDK